MATHKNKYISLAGVLFIGLNAFTAHAESFTYDAPTLLVDKKLGKIAIPVSQSRMNGNEFSLTFTLEDAVSGVVILQNPDGDAAKSMLSGTYSHAFKEPDAVSGPQTQTITFKLPAGEKIEGDWTLSIKTRSLMRKKPATLKQWTLNFPESGSDASQQAPYAGIDVPAVRKRGKAANPS